MDNFNYDCDRVYGMEVPGTKREIRPCSPQDIAGSHETSNPYRGNVSGLSDDLDARGFFFEPEAPCEFREMCESCEFFDSAGGGMSCPPCCHTTSPGVKSSAYGAFTYIGVTITVAPGQAVPFTNFEEPPVGITFYDGNTFRVDAPGTYLITYGIHYTIAEGGALPVSTGLQVNGVFNMHFTATSGVTAAPDAWNTISGIKVLAAGDILQLINNGTNAFNLDASNITQAYITFLRIA